MSPSEKYSGGFLTGEIVTHAAPSPGVEWQRCRSSVAGSAPWFTEWVLFDFFFSFPILGLLCVSKRKTFKNMRELASWPALSPESPCSLDSDFTASLESDFVMTSVLTLRDHVKIAAQTSLCCGLVRAEQSRCLLEN